MMITVCDICGDRKNVNRVIYPYDTQPDGAGSSETVSEVFDLCQTHEIEMLKAIVKNSKARDNIFEVNRDIINYIKNRIGKNVLNAKTKN